MNTVVIDLDVATYIKLAKLAAEKNLTLEDFLFIFFNAEGCPNLSI